jgi:fucose 4-O-acetylase-like acetyltransferase
MVLDLTAVSLYMYDSAKNTRSGGLNLANGSIGIDNSSWSVYFVSDLISQGLARVAIPLFFFISGYLFFYGFSWSLENYAKKLHNRVRTLLIPYIFWNLGTFIIYVGAQLLPLTSKLLASTHPIYLQKNIYDYINVIFGLSIDPVSYQFWFICDLMAMVILVPILLVMLKKIPVIFISVLALLWYSDLWPFHMPAALAALFFSVGGMLSFYKIEIFKFDKWGVQLSIIFLILLLLNVLTKKYAFNCGHRSENVSFRPV